MKTIRKFDHVNARTTEEAVHLLGKFGEKAWVNAGGTDLMGTMRFEILCDYPEVVINLKTISGLDYIKEEEGLLEIGTLTRLPTKNPYIILMQAIWNFTPTNWLTVLRSYLKNTRNTGWMSIRLIGPQPRLNGSMITSLETPLAQRQLTTDLR